jgi:GNAT superfamily N-acetyltransferase
MALGYVRPARVDEADEIARIQLSTWRIAYRRLLPRRVLDELDQDWLAGHWRKAIEAPPSDRHRVLVAVEQAGEPPAAGEEGRAPTVGPGAAGDQADRRSDLRAPTVGPGAAGGRAGRRSDLVGFVATGPADETALAPDEPAELLRPDLAAITELLVEPRWGRRGHGSRLLAAAVDLWRADGFRTALAWVYEQDPASKRFLTGAGWAPDGAHRALDVDDLLVPQLRLHTSVEQGTEADG